MTKLPCSAPIVISGDEMRIASSYPPDKAGEGTKMKRIVSLYAMLLVTVADAGPPCSFNSDSMAFRGTDAQQATCLLREVRPLGQIGEETNLGNPLRFLLGQRIKITPQALGQYLRTHGISQDAVGGSLTEPVPATLQYFVIHDTSSPNVAGRPFPKEIDEVSWPANRLDRWTQSPNPRAHLFINRVGDSATAVPFSTPWRATKFELLDLRRRGLCIHVELIQPRRSDQAGKRGNDAIAPIPGFTQAQYDRLAVVYVAASVRAQTWLKPAFHAVLDSGIPDAHDDPQHFSTEIWQHSLGSLLSAIPQ